MPDGRMRPFLRGGDPMSVETVEVAGVVARREATKRKGGSEIRVSIADAGNGAAVDVRRFITTGPREILAGNGKARSQYVGPTREGLWLQPSEAFELADLLTYAARAAEMMQEVEYGKGEVA